MYTLPAILDRGRSLFGDVEVTDGETVRTYAETYENVQRRAGGLLEAGVEPGDVVAIADWNTPAFFELLYAVTGIGAVAYPVNLNLPPEQMGYTLQASDTKWFLYSSDFAGLAEAFPGESRDIETLELGDPVALGADQDDYAVVLFTSGTTGRPKAIRYTHAQMTQGALSIAHQTAEFETPATLSASSTIVPGIPVFHILAWGAVVIGPYLGTKLVFSGRFDPATMGDVIESEPEPWSNLVPTMAKQLLATDADLSGLHVVTGGSAIEKGLMEALDDRGVSVSTIYGGTDMLAASISIWTEHARGQGADYLRRVMHPVPFGEFRLAHREGMDEDMGEIQFQAPWLPEGYYGDPEKTEEAFVTVPADRVAGGEERWFNTGDIGRRTPDGGIVVLDRIKDAIKSGGEWIPTSILESLISEVEWVDHVAVIGQADEEWGERPVAIVSPVAGHEVDEDELEAHLAAQVEAGQINDWWVPEAYYTVDEMPLTSTGKIQKTALRERFE